MKMSNWIKFAKIADPFNTSQQLFQMNKTFRFIFIVKDLMFVLASDTVETATTEAEAWLKLCGPRMRQ